MWKFTKALVPAFIMFFASARGQGDPAYSIRAAAVDVAEGHDTLWMRAEQGKEPIEIRLNTRSFSEPVTYKGPARTAFYASAEDASAKEPPDPLAEVSLTDTSMLLIFAPTEKGNGYAVYPVAAKQFPFGSFRLINLSIFSMGVELDLDRIILREGEAKTVFLRGEQKNVPVRVQAADANGKVRLIRQTSWSLVPTQRELVFFLPNPRNDFVTMRHFVDSAAPATADKP